MVHGEIRRQTAKLDHFTVHTCNCAQFTMCCRESILYDPDIFPHKNTRNAKFRAKEVRIATTAAPPETRNFYNSSAVREKNAKVLTVIFASHICSNSKFPARSFPSLCRQEFHTDHHRVHQPSSGGHLPESHKNHCGRSKRATT